MGFREYRINLQKKFFFNHAELSVYYLTRTETQVILSGQQKVCVKLLFKVVIILSSVVDSGRINFGRLDPDPDPGEQK